MINYKIDLLKNNVSENDNTILNSFESDSPLECFNWLEQNYFSIYTPTTIQEYVAMLFMELESEPNNSSYYLVDNPTRQSKLDRVIACYNALDKIGKINLDEQIAMLDILEEQINKFINCESLALYTLRNLENWQFGDRIKFTEKV